MTFPLGKLGLRLYNPDASAHLTNAVAMTSDDSQPPASGSEKAPSDGGGRFSPWFTAPEPLRQVFSRYPLRTYAANDLPLRAPPKRDLPSLYVFTTKEGARNGDPSFNPACLKWQAGGDSL